MKTKMGMRRILKHGLLLLMLAPVGCSFDGCGTTSIEQAARQDVEQTVLKFMPLEIMFPDEKVRELARLAGDGQVAELVKLKQNGLDVNSRGREGVTPLFWAMRNLRGFRKLLDLGADPNIEFGSGESVMHWAAETSDVRFLDSALQHGGDPNLIVGEKAETPLFRAAQRSQQAVESLLKAGANINAKSASGETPIMAAADVLRFDLVLLLLNQGADFTGVDRDGLSLTSRISRARTVLRMDSDQGKWFAECVTWLKAHGADVQD